MEESRQEDVSKWFLIPQRYIVSILCSLAVCLTYGLRTLLSISITEMVSHPNETHNFTNNDVCPGGTQLDTVQNPRLLYDWDEAIQALVLSSFYWGYIISHIPARVIAERCGGKYVLGIGILSASILNIFTPLVIHLSRGSWKALAAVRVLEGLSEGAVFPAVTAIQAQWIPAKEKSTIGAICYTTAYLGTVISLLGCGRTISTTKIWSPFFYMFGGFGVLWFVVWQLIGYSNPDTHPFLGEKERLHLHHELDAHVIHNVKLIPWGAIFSSGPVWALVVAQVGHDWGWYIMIMELPKYMKDVLKFSIDDNALWSSTPLLAMSIGSIVFGFLSDWMINREVLSTTAVRKIYTTVGYMGPACFLLVASYAGCNRVMAVASFTVAFSLKSAYYAGVRVNALDLSPNYAGILIGLTNMVGIVAAIVGPSLVAVIAPDRSLLQWRYIYWIISYVYAFTNVVFLIFASGDEQPWNNAAQK